MFSIINLTTSKDASINVSFKEKHLEFVISSVIAAKGKPKLDGDLQFVLLNAYLDYKGSAFKENLFNQLEISYNIMQETRFTPGTDRIPYDGVDNIIDIFDFEDVFNYIKNHYKLEPPKHLKVEFEEQIEKDARGSRDQTYLKDDYLELATLVTIIKATLGPICLYGHIKKDDVARVTKEYYLFSFYRNNEKLNSYAPMIKLIRFTEKLIEQSDNGAFEDRKRVLELGISLEDLPMYLLSLAIFQKLAISTLIDDDENKNIVNRIYNYINSKLKSTNSTSKTIRDKEPMTDTDSATADKESVPESLRVYEDLAPGMTEEMNWAVNSVEKILSQLPKNFRDRIDMKALEDAKVFTKSLQDIPIARPNVIFLSYIFKCILDPRSLDYIRLDGIINLTIVGFAYLWGSGFKNLALLLVSIVLEQGDDLVLINPTINKPRVSKELKEAIDALYPYRKVLNVNRDATENASEKAITELCKDYETCIWKTLAPMSYSDGYVLVAPDIKIQFLEFLLHNERMVYGGN